MLDTLGIPSRAVTTPLPIVELEDLIGATLSMAELGLSAPPTVAQRYEVIELRGRGARGLVVRARDQTLSRVVALKLYPPIEDPRVETEAMREAQALARLEHPNVVRVFDVARGTVQASDAALECLFLSMEFIEGHSLRSWMRNERRSSREILGAFLAAGEGLAAAHEAGLVHRDFKPENVMIEAKGRVRVVDFGLARGDGAPVSDDLADHSAPLDVRMTQVGTALGTVEYMAPEARLGYADARSDQFSFAMALWESLTGQLPFDAQAGDWLGPDETAFHAAEQLEPDIRHALTRALARDPSHRFGAMTFLVRALKRARGAPRRRKIVIGALAIGLISVSAGLVVSLNAVGGRDEAPVEVAGPSELASTPGAPGEKPEPPPPKSRRSETEVAATMPNRTGVLWWCLCYEYNARDGTVQPATACRSGRDVCDRLERAIRSGKGLFVAGSEGPGCEPIAGATPWEHLGPKRRWESSSKEGAWWVPGKCMLR